MRKNTCIWKELTEHLPYTVFSVSMGFIVLGILNFFAQLSNASIIRPTQDLYHIFHSLHLLFSAAATVAMMRKYKENKFKALIVGLIGSVGICGLSDIIIPYLAGFLFNVRMHCHICVIHHPLMILPFLLTGLFLGLCVSTHKAVKGFIFSHACHVLISSMASILYLISFGLATHWVHHMGAVFVYSIIAVTLPCCCSDIIFPILTLKNKNLYL